MPPDSTDARLVRAYATEGSETAFRALVGRHVDLVFATALRQVGDAGMAEEITQNVFVTLARKAARLGGHETLAGWLHRAAILEAKARIRKELRRVRREEIAGRLATLHSEGASSLEALLPLLDEALLGLRESDRLALLHRFFEDRSLRDVGHALGVDEDAARKRVSRALDRLTVFFRDRGFAVPTGTASASFFAHAAQPAPASLAATAASAGLASGSSATGLNLLFFHVMTMTKTQTAAVFVLLVTLPLGLQWQTQAKIQRALTEASTQLAAMRQENTDFETLLQQSRAALAQVQTDKAQAEMRQAELGPREATATLPAVYQWDDASNRARVPKDLLKQARFQSMETTDGRLTEQIKELLQMTGQEALRTEAALRRFLADFRTVEAASLKQVPPHASELRGRSEEDVRVFEAPDLSEDYRQLRESFQAALRLSLGEGRVELFNHGLRGWLPSEDQSDGVIGTQVLFAYQKRVQFIRPGVGSDNLRWAIQVQFTGGSASTGVSYSPPEPYRSLISDWLELERLLQLEKQRQSSATPLNPQQ